MAIGLTIEELKQKIKDIQDYLGPRVNYTSDEWPFDKVDRWLMEYLFLLKTRYYQRLKMIKNKKLIQKLSGKSRNLC